MVAISRDANGMCNYIVELVQNGFTEEIIISMFNYYKQSVQT
jgi:hypothetical protein